MGFGDNPGGIRLQAPGTSQKSGSAFGACAVESSHEGGALRLEAIDRRREVDHETPESFDVPSCLPGVFAFDRAPDGGIADGVVIEMLKHIEFGLGLAKLLMKPGYLISQREQALLCASHWRIVRVGVGAEARVVSSCALAGVAEWQTRRTQNPLSASSWGFESPSRHESPVRLTPGA